jgi:glycosyltransferase involved in cell wall biosynthesis
MDNPLCSVLIPSYNVERYVAAAIESALAQTYRPIEIVVVDDGSTDSTGDVVRSYLQHPEIRYVHQQNRGLAGARNRAIDESHGELIGLLDADDIWMPGKVEACAEYLGAHPDVGWVTTDCYLMRDFECTEDRYYGTIVPKDFPVGVEQQLQGIATRNFVSVSTVIRRELFDRFGRFDEGLRRSEDYDLWIRFLLGGSSVGRVAEPLGFYRLRADSLSADRAPQWQSHLTVLERHIPALWARGARAPARECYDIARRLANSGRRARAARFAYMAARAPDLGLRARTRFAAGAARAVVAPRSGHTVAAPGTGSG